MGETEDGRSTTVNLVSPKPKKVVHRDAKTGQFVSGEEYEGIEVVNFAVGTGMPADKVDGSTGFSGGNVGEFEGLLLIDYDDLCSRHERLDLLQASHLINVYVNSTGTEDGTAKAMAEVSSSPARQIADDLDLDGTELDGAPALSIPESEAATTTDDSIDIIGRVMMAVGHQPFSDTATGIGGGGSAGRDEVIVNNLPEPCASFYGRDELYLNGAFTVWNVADSGVHLDLVGQHIYGVVEE